MAHTTASTAALDGTRSGTRGKPGSAPAMAGNMKTFSTPLVEDLLADKVKAREAKERAELEAALAAAAQPPDYHYGDGYDSALQRRQEHLLAIKQRYEDEARRAKEYQAVRHGVDIGGELQLSGRCRCCMAGGSWQQQPRATAMAF